MDINERKRIVTSALVGSFVDDYNAYKNTLEEINNDLRISQIPYQYDYDGFCKDFLMETEINIEKIDIFEVNDFTEFYGNLWKFNLYSLQTMLEKKLTSLGFDYDTFWEGNIKRGKPPITKGKHPAKVKRKTK